MTDLQEYFYWVDLMIKTRNSSTQEEEDQIIDRLDVIWYKMTKDEREMASFLTSKYYVQADKEAE